MGMWKGGALGGAGVRNQKGGRGRLNGYPPTACPIHSPPSLALSTPYQRPIHVHDQDAGCVDGVGSRLWDGGVPGGTGGGGCEQLRPHNGPLLGPLWRMHSSPSHAHPPTRAHPGLVEGGPRLCGGCRNGGRIRLRPRVTVSRTTVYTSGFVSGLVSRCTDLYGP